MNNQIIECVPNFSEGRSKSVIDSITQEIINVSGVRLLDVDMGYDTNRTVVTFAGSPELVLEAAYNSIKKASELIDMKHHKGAHARMGATDVCPIIPVSNTSIDDCVKYSRDLAEKVGKKLKIPVFLYEYSAASDSRKNLANIRSGEYELMDQKIKQKEWFPDFGPSKFNYKSGVTAIGARDFLIAYNINLNTSDRKKATDIALDIREKGRAKRDSKGKIVRDKKGKIIKVPGLLKSVKAVGWYIDEYNQAQVSMNLTNYKITSIHKAFEEVSMAARKRGLRVTGSEIVGLVPKDAMLDAGNFFLNKQNSINCLPEKDIIDCAIISLGLNDISNFNADKSIIENALVDKNNLFNESLEDFIDELSRKSPAPGGGSVSALAGALSAALTSMVINLSIFKNKDKYGNKAQKLKDQFIQLIQEDASSFDSVMNAFKMKKKTKADQNSRKSAIQEAYKNAVSPPMKMLDLSLSMLEIIRDISNKVNKNCMSDLGVSIEMVESCANGAVLNIDINLKEIDDKKYTSMINKRVSKVLSNNDIILYDLKKNK
tara:strand:+ start:705 stop:2339 length:1635 start_codon:yes stop_codon:yes gene_type:complete